MTVGAGGRRVRFLSRHLCLSEIFGLQGQNRLSRHCSSRKLARTSKGPFFTFRIPHRGRRRCLSVFLAVGMTDQFDMVVGQQPAFARVDRILLPKDGVAVARPKGSDRCAGPAGLRRDIIQPGSGRKGRAAGLVFSGIIFSQAMDSKRWRLSHVFHRHLHTRSAGMPAVGVEQIFTLLQRLVQVETGTDPAPSPPRGHCCWRQDHRRPVVGFRGWQRYR